MEQMRLILDGLVSPFQAGGQEPGERKARPPGERSHAAEVQRHKQHRARRRLAVTLRRGAPNKNHHKFSTQAGFAIRFEDFDANGYRINLNYSPQWRSHLCEHTHTYTHTRKNTHTCITSREQGAHNTIYGL